MNSTNTKVRSGGLRTILRGSGRRDMTEAERAYIAGVVDSDGYIGIVNHGRQIRIAVSMTNREVIRWFNDTSGVGTCAACKPRSDQNKVQVFEWRCFSKAASDILEQIYSFLIAKKLQASIALRFAYFLAARTNPNAKITSIEAEFGETCAEQIRALNSRLQNRYRLNLPLAAYDPAKKAGFIKKQT